MVLARTPRRFNGAALSVVALLAVGQPMQADDVVGHLDQAAPNQHLIDGPQGTLSAQVAGTGAGLPIVFVHGDSSRAAQWDNVQSRLAPGHRTLAVDLRGHGASEPARDGDYGYAGRAEDVLAAADADAEGLDRFILVAHSGGAGVALELGAGHPERVAGLLMVDPATDPRVLPPEVHEGFVADLASPDSLDVQQAYFTSLAGPNAAVRERILHDAEAVDPAARLGVGEALADWDPEVALDAFPAPMRIVATKTNDGPAALWHLRPSISHVVVGGTGHWLQLEKPDLVADEVERFAAALVAEATTP